MSGTVEAFRLHAWPMVSSNRLVLIGGLVQGIKACQYNTFLQNRAVDRNHWNSSCKTIYSYSYLYSFLLTSVEFTFTLVRLVNVYFCECVSSFSNPGAVRQGVFIATV